MCENQDTPQQQDTAALEYELIDIEWSLDYDFTDDATSPVVRDDAGEQSEDESKELRIEYDAEGIPMGSNHEDEVIRRNIIHEYLQEWRHTHPEGSVYNNDLNEDIKVVQISLREACKHSARSYKSTKAALMLETIIGGARKYGESKTKPSDVSQKGFEKMIIMTYSLQSLGLVKLTIGVKRKSHEKIEYGISVPPESVPLIAPELRIQEKGKKKKASHRRR